MNEYDLFYKILNCCSIFTGAKHYFSIVPDFCERMVHRNVWARPIISHHTRWDDTTGDFGTWHSFQGKSTTGPHENTFKWKCKFKALFQSVPWKHLIFLSQIGDFYEEYTNGGTMWFPVLISKVTNSGTK